MDDTLIGVVMALDNVLALFMLPLFGKLSDKTRTRVGRRMPYIVGGTVAAVVCLAILPLAERQNNLVLFFAGLGCVLIAMATYRSPAVALMPDVTPKPLRSQGNAVINLMGALGGMLMLGTMQVLFAQAGHGRGVPPQLPAHLCGAGHSDGRVHRPAVLEDQRAGLRARHGRGEPRRGLSPDEEETAPDGTGKKCPRPRRAALPLFWPACFCGSWATTPLPPVSAGTPPRN